jgi:hypothetical protein
MAKFEVDCGWIEARKDVELIVGIGKTLRAWDGLVELPGR